MVQLLLLHPLMLQLKDRPSYIVLCGTTYTSTGGGKAAGGPPANGGDLVAQVVEVDPNQSAPGAGQGTGNGNTPVSNNSVSRYMMEETLAVVVVEMLVLAVVVELVVLEKSDQLHANPGPWW